MILNETILPSMASIAAQAEDISFCISFAAASVFM